MNLPEHQGFICFSDKSMRREVTCKWLIDLIFNFSSFDFQLWNLNLILRNRLFLQLPVPPHISALDWPAHEPFISPNRLRHEAVVQRSIWGAAWLEYESNHLILFPHLTSNTDRHLVYSSLQVSAGEDVCGAGGYSCLHRCRGRVGNLVRSPDSLVLSYFPISRHQFIDFFFLGNSFIYWDRIHILHNSCI